MFGSKSNKLGQSIEQFDTILGESLRVEGDLIVNQAIRINGFVNGNIFQADGATATVAIASGASVIGDIRAGQVIVSGRVKGNIFSTDRVEVLETADIEGDIVYKTIGIALGAKVTGQIGSIEKGEPKLVVEKIIKLASQPLSA